MIREEEDGDLKVVPTAAGLRSVGITPHPGGSHRREATRLLWRLHEVLSDAADVLGVDVPGPLDDVRHHQALHQDVVAGPDAECSDGASVERVHGAERANHVGVHGRPVAARFKVSSQDLVLPPLVHSGSYQGVFAVLVRDDDIDDHAGLGAVVDDGDVWSQEA